MIQRLEDLGRHDIKGLSDYNRDYALSVYGKK